MIVRQSLLIFITFLLIDTVLCATQFHIRSYIRDTQNKPRLSKFQVEELLENEVSASLQHDSFVISDIVLHRRAAHKPQHVEFDVIVNSETDPKTKVQLSSMNGIRAMTIDQLDDVPTAVPMTDLPTPDCMNGGYRDANGTCVCTEQWQGDLCDALYCFNWGIYDNDYPYQCNCPPGFNDYQCLNRDCRPPAQDDINPPARSLVIVMPNTIPFLAKRTAIMNNLVQTVNQLQSYEPGWIGYYYAVNFGGDEDGIYFDTIQTTNLTDFVNQMLNVVPYQDAPGFGSFGGDQDLIEAISVAYFEPYNGYPIGNSIIMAFSDTANLYDEDGYTDYTGYNSKMEQIILWRSKVYFFIIDDVTVGNRVIDVSSPGYDNLRYFSKHIHAPLFHFNETEIPQVMNSTASKLYRTQYTSVRLLTGDPTFDMYTYSDFEYETGPPIQLTVTLDLLKDQSGSITMYRRNKTVQPSSSGKYWQMYEIPYDSFSVTFVRNGSNFDYSVFQWVSSQESFLWGIHETQNVDIGGIYTVPEKQNHIGVGAVSTEWVPYYVFYTGVDASSGNAIGYNTDYEQRPSCTLTWELIGIDQCSSGPYVHIFQSLTQMGSIIRVFPAYCKHALDTDPLMDNTKMFRNKAAVQAKPIPVQTADAADVTCNSTGLTAFADARYQPIRQFIFVVEWTDNNYVFLQDFANHINNWINSVYNKNYQQIFTLIFYDMDSYRVKTVMSEHYKDRFLQRVNELTTQKLHDIIHENFNGTEKFSDSISAVITANMQTVAPRAIVHVLTQTPESNGLTPGAYLILPKGFEVNYFYYSDDVAAYPFSAITRQTNGRWFNSAYTSTMIQNFAEESQSMELIFDEMYQLPVGQSVTVPLVVERQSNVLEILVTGIYTSFEFTHPTANVTLVEYSIQDYAYKAVYDVSAVTDSNLQMIIFCTYCTVQVRVATPLKLYFGFTSNQAEDTNVQYQPDAWIRANATLFDQTYIVGHVSGLKPNETIAYVRLTIYQGSMSTPVFNANKAMYISFMLQPRSGCGYQFVGTVDAFFLRQLKYDGLKFIAVLATTSGDIYKRIEYYYVPQDLKLADTCNGNPTNIYGECVCGQNYTGEYCQTPICQNGGYSNFGACNCADETAGKFCEIVITENVSDPSVTSMPSTTPPMPPSTTTWGVSTTVPTTQQPIQTTTTTTTTTQAPPPPCSSPIPVVTQPPSTTPTTPSPVVTNAPLSSSTISTPPTANVTVPAPKPQGDGGKSAGAITYLIGFVFVILKYC